MIVLSLTTDNCFTTDGRPLFHHRRPSTVPKPTSVNCSDTNDQRLFRDRQPFIVQSPRTVDCFVPTHPITDGDRTHCSFADSSNHDGNPWLQHRQIQCLQLRCASPATAEDDTTQLSGMNPTFPMQTEPIAPLPTAPTVTVL